MKKYFKKISFGISLNITIDEYESIIKEFFPYISSVYFSLPFGDEFHTREGVKREYNQENAEEKLFNILTLFRKYGIKLEAVINQYHISIETLENSLNMLDDFIKVDSICCLDEYLECIYNHYKGKMYLISSFNNSMLTENDIDKVSHKYNMIVISRQFMRSPRNIDMIKESTKFEIKLLVNNGCAFNCMTCRAGQNRCREIFRINRKRNSPEELYAIQSFFPWELDRLFEKVKSYSIIDEIKLSSRPCSYKYLKDCLNSYIHNQNEKTYIEESYNNYHLWGRQANLIPYFKEFNLDRINYIKKRLWNIED